MHLRIFVSSPGDVADERSFAQQVIEQELPKDPLLRGQITCEAMRWDDPNAPVAMPATQTPQEAVDRGLAKPSACDAVIVILWSRMGTPLPDTFRKPNGEPYLSGTEWEYEDAISAVPPPHVLLYRRRAKVVSDLDDSKFEEKRRQYGLVKQFFDRFRAPDGSLKGGFTEYETPQEFRDRLRADLRAYVQRRLAEAPRAERPEPIRVAPPYAELARALRSGNAIAVLGAGASLSGRPPGARWDADAPQFLPSGLDLSRLLADDSGFPSPDDRDRLTAVASYYEAFGTRATLRARLRQILDASARAAIPPLHRLLADIPTPLLIVTTNHDVQLERAFAAAQRPYDLVVYPAERRDLGNAVLWWPHGAAEPSTPATNELDIDLTTTTVIFKMHGSFLPETDAWDGFVITEEDYVEFLSRVAGKSAIPALISAHFHGRSLLFIGFSLLDWNVRTMLRALSRYFARWSPGGDQDEIPSWAVADGLSELERRLWLKRGIYPYEVPIDEFVETLRARLGS
jgi:SIR2-like domain